MSSTNGLNPGLPHCRQTLYHLSHQGSPQFQKRSVFSIFILLADFKAICFVVQSLSFVWLFVTPWTAACQVSLSFTISQCALKFMSIESVMLSNHLILCHPLFLLLQSFPASGAFPASWLFTSGGQSIVAICLHSLKWMVQLKELFYYFLKD